MIEKPQNPALADNIDWTSPISASNVAGGSISLSESHLDGDCVYWLERRPSEAGRCTIVKNRNGETVDVLPQEYNCRSRVHEYGGGAYCVADDVVYFVNDSDQQIYMLREGTVTQVTLLPGCRFADLVVTPGHDLLFAVCEDHNADDLPGNSLVCINLHNRQLHILSDTHDFYTSPSYHAGSRQLAWVSWDFPQMPWDGTQLHLATLDEHLQLVHQQCVAGSDSESILQPRWHNDDLYYVSDSSDWWNLYRWRDNNSRAVLPMAAEFGLPHWVFGQSSYAFTADAIIAGCNANGSQQLLHIDLASGAHHVLTTAYSHFEYIQANADACCMIASSATSSATIICIDAQETVTTVKPANDDSIDTDYISVAEPRTYRSRHDDDIHALYYPPRNPDFASNDPPPVIVTAHGGPTSQAHDVLDIKKQFWTTRGFAILDVNYSGSTGYGRAYRQRLQGQWGIRDVSDVCDAVKGLVDEGLAHPHRLVIRGSSAGGYTTLAALTFENVFCAGTSYYGISDLVSLTHDTHKFEARYLDGLVGAWPKDADSYNERSPINFSEQVKCPVLFLQGVEDRVVPKSQAERMISAIRRNGIPVAYRQYENEQHGFRQAETIIDAIESEYCFYRKLFSYQDVECDLALEDQ